MSEGLKQKARLLVPGSLTSDRRLLVCFSARDFAPHFGAQSVRKRLVLEVKRFPLAQRPLSRSRADGEVNLLAIPLFAVPVPAFPHGLRPLFDACEGISPLPGRSWISPTLSA